MARVELAVTQITRAGAPQVETVGIADGHKFANTGRAFVYARNVNTTTGRTITFVTPQEVVGLPVADLAVVVPAGSVRYIGPFPTDTFNQEAGADAGMVYVNYDVPADWRIVVYRL